MVEKDFPESGHGVQLHTFGCNPEAHQGLVLELLVGVEAKEQFAEGRILRLELIEDGNSLVQGSLLHSHFLANVAQPVHYLASVLQVTWSLTFRYSAESLWDCICWKARSKSTLSSSERARSQP